SRTVGEGERGWSVRIGRLLLAVRGGRLLLLPQGDLLVKHVRIRRLLPQSFCVPWLPPMVYLDISTAIRAGGQLGYGAGRARPIEKASLRHPIAQESEAQGISEFTSFH